MMTSRSTSATGAAVVVDVVEAAAVVVAAVATGAGDVVAPEVSVQAAASSTNAARTEIWKRLRVGKAISSG